MSTLIACDGLSLRYSRRASGEADLSDTDHLDLVEPAQALQVVLNDDGKVDIESSGRRGVTHLKARRW